VNGDEEHLLELKAATRRDKYPLEWVTCGGVDNWENQLILSHQPAVGGMMDSRENIT
jgi:hypothetical protein